MRILVATHVPLASWEVQRPPLGIWIDSLARAGHEAQVVAVDSGAGPPAVPGTHLITCRSQAPGADLPWEAPSFDLSAASAFAFLSDPQLGDYRDVLRRRLDGLIAEFNPHLVQLTELWMFAHVALESGVPYAVNVRGPELDVALADGRYRPWCQQAAENAGAIWVSEPPVREKLLALFGPLDHVDIRSDGAHDDRLATFQEIVCRRRRFD